MFQRVDRLPFLTEILCGLFLFLYSQNKLQGIQVEIKRYTTGDKP